MFIKILRKIWTIFFKILSLNWTRLSTLSTIPDSIWVFKSKKIDSLLLKYYVIVQCTNCQSFLFSCCFIALTNISIELKKNNRRNLVLSPDLGTLFFRSHSIYMIFTAGKSNTSQVCISEKHKKNNCRSPVGYSSFYFSRINRLLQVYG